MSSQSKSPQPASPPNTSGPLIPETFLDVPTQRLYVLSLGVIFQAIKIFDFFRTLLSDSQASYGSKWLLVDFLFCVGLAQLRIPRLRYSLSVVVLQIITLWLLDGFIFGGLALNVGGRAWLSIPFVGLSGHGSITSTPSTSGFWDLMSSAGLGMITGSTTGDKHLLGQHTVRMSPISTAFLNPQGETYCLATPGQNILIPILLNNTTPVTVKYSLTPLGYVEDNNSRSKVEQLELNARDLKAIETARLEGLQVARTAASRRNADDYNEYDYDDDEDDTTDTKGLSTLQKTQQLAHIRLNKPGILRLERVLDSSGTDARLVYPSEVTVVPCPRAEFAIGNVANPDEDMRCAAPGLATGAGEELNLEIDLYGVPPLSLRWYKEVDGRQESFMVEGIENSGHTHHGSSDEGRSVGHRVPVDLKIPLNVTLDALGRHSYVLESVTDALGNHVVAGSGKGTSGDTLAPTHRFVTVLRRPTASFQHCGPGNPMSLLIGSQAPLGISLKDADALDGPWDLSIKYEPEKDATSRRRQKGWTKTYQTQPDDKSLRLNASAPGEYTIVDVRGKYCEGDILSPDTCKVVERPIPSAEIEWKKIHECSGDIGVSASLVLHGTSPFQVYYRTQRDREPPRELSKTFTSSRGEITIQPERSGHYVFQVVQISDANYKRVDLKGPSIDQIVHPPAHAEFTNSSPGGRGKKKISSCSGSIVDVDVDLRGTGPWNLDVQIVGPKGSEILRVPGITTPRKTIQIPIPKQVDQDGGSFEIDLVSIEDAYGCKRELSVPGIMVNVRRLRPTARFYGKKDDRHVTVLDNEPANLPLRLTGDGPWRVKYRRSGAPEHILTETITSPNGELRVTEQGHYEIVEISDSQCPGNVERDQATYTVHHILRPSAKLASETRFTYEPFNGSYILPPICEGVSDHVDLELTGRPPFQIMYNVARDTETGNTKILDQPTFSSIQPRTSFQLHTSEAARIYYEVKQIGDAAYPLARNKNAVIPRSERLLFEQQVLMRPSARFRNHNRLSYCLNDVLLPRETASQDGVIILEGTTPFTLQLSIRNLATSETRLETVELHQTIWKLDIPSYLFHSVGPHLVTIESVQDASHCEQSAPDPLYRSIWVDVAETAAIVPFDRREDFCVGDAIQFQLEGTPPWSIGYRINGKSYTQEAKLSPFSIVQQQPGEFAITSIAHQQKMCKTAVTDLRYNIHALPSARVGHGEKIIQSIHEGDQAEIVFTLIGEPPFTFTYQRAELTNKKGVQGKVLETHTVSGVTTKEYSIFSALEGTWTVTFIADRYCRYPPVQPELP